MYRMAQYASSEWRRFAIRFEADFLPAFACTAASFPDYIELNAG
jgi:hypothetical protein